MEEKKEPTKIHKKCIMEEKIDRLENHFRVYKADMVDVKEILKDVKVSLIGSNLNGNKGMVHLLDEIDIRVQKLENKQILDNDKLETLKWFQRGLIGIIFSYVLWLLTK